MSKNLLKEAIAEAKQVREAAVQNAYDRLKESITPSIKEMLASQLEEEIELEDESLEEAELSGFKEVKTKTKKTVAEAEEDEEDVEDEAAEEEKSDEEEAEDDAEAAEEDEEAAEEDEEAAEEDVEAEEAADDETPISDLTLGDLRELISDMVTQIAGPAEPAPEGDLGADMDAGDVEGMGDEEAPIGDPAGTEELPAEDPAAEADEELPAEEDDEIDISEILKELEAEEGDRKVVDPSNTQNNEIQSLRKKLQESNKMIQSLKKTLAEVNLMNSKLIYTVKLSSKTLSESQKNKALQVMDKAKSPREVKAVYKVISESIEKTGRRNIPMRGRASKAVGKSTSGNMIVESNDVVTRMQQLAGIID